MWVIVSGITHWSSIYMGVQEDHEYSKQVFSQVWQTHIVTIALIFLVPYWPHKVTLQSSNKVHAQHEQTKFDILGQDIKQGNKVCLKESSQLSRHIGVKFPTNSPNTILDKHNIVDGSTHLQHVCVDWSIQNGSAVFDV